MAESLSIVVPMYNEQGIAQQAVRKLLDAMKGYEADFEILIVESGSTDQTPKIVDELAKKHRQVRALHQKKKEGLGSAIRHGFGNSKMDLVLYMDGDNPFDAKVIRQAIPLMKDADAVLGYRLGDRESFKRWFFSKGYNALIRLVVGVRVRDVNFSFKMLRKEALAKLDLRSNGFFIDAEIIAELKRKNCAWQEMGIPYTERAEGSSTVRIGPKLIAGMLKEMFAYIGRKDGLR